MKKTIFSIISTIIILAILIASFLIYQNIKQTNYEKNLEPFSNGEKEVMFTINEGDTMAIVTKNLEKEKLIKSSEDAYKYAVDNQLNTIYPGTFLLKPNMSTQEILKVLTNNDSQNITITFIEGQWIEDYVKVIAKQTNLDESSILAYWTNIDNINSYINEYGFLTDEILKENIRYAFEGYIFPDTYSIPYPKDLNVENFMNTLTHQIFDNFQNKWNELNPYIEKMNNRFSYHELVTFASIVEFEGNNASDRDNIAGVFYNRLDARMPLQSCATVDYAMNEHKLQYSLEDLKFDSPYNTYSVSALPIGPVSNPSFESLKATVNPAKNNYYYFLSDVYGDSTTYFSETLKEHEEKKEKYGLNGN